MDGCDLPSFRASTASYYALLGVPSDSSAEQIRRAFRKLALQWHPDRWTRCAPSLLNRAKRKFQQIQEAYSVLSDKKKRRLYDLGLYDRRDDEEEDQEFRGFLQEMVSLMAQARRERESYSLEELKAMLAEMAGGFGGSGYSKRARFETGFGAAGIGGGYCR